jgi:hypothetical protein
MMPTKTPAGSKRGDAPWVFASWEWKGAIAQPGLSEYSFGAADKEIFYGQATTSPLLNAAPSTPRARERERERGAANQAPARGGSAAAGQHILPKERGV